MFKKLLATAVFLVMVGSVFAQTIVSTTPENRKVVLEEFTGINCVFCPQGHAIARGIRDANPGNVFLINIHQGSFANPGSGQPDFRTPFGNAIAGQSGLVGYPAGTVNRQIFPGQSQSGGNDTAMSRGQWSNAANQVLGDNSYLNMAVESNINVSTRELTVHVEAFYTGNSPEAVNKLNVALLQNHTLGPQTGGNMGNNYEHNHRLVWLVTGQWGDDVSPTTTGTFIDRNYSYTIPAAYNGVPAVLTDMEVVVFMTESTQDIPSGNGGFPTYNGLPNNNDANLVAIEPVRDQCDGYDLVPTITVENLGNNPITSLDITYNVNGGTNEVYTYNGNILALQSETIELPGISYTQVANNTLTVSLESDENNSNNNATADFGQATEGRGTVYLELTTDNFGAQTRWNVTASNGDILYMGGPYPNNTNIQRTFQLPQDCYEINIIDTVGNGGGPVTVTDSDGTVIIDSDGNYGDGIFVNYGSDGVLGLGDNSIQNVVLYPNPANTILNIANAQNANMEVYDVVGKLITSQELTNTSEQLDVSSFQTGIYFVKLTDGSNSLTKRIVINR